MNFNLWIAAALAVLFFHPYLWYPISLSWLRRAPVLKDEAAKLPSATLVFCAYNEMKALPEKIENLKAIRAVYPDLKFACYVDLSTDDTLEILRAQGDLIEVMAATERTGKAAGMAKLAAAATTEVMIFTDANVIVEPRCIQTMLSYFTDPEIGGVCGRLIYTNPNESEMAATSSAYWRLEELIKRKESASGSTMGADGSLFATRLAYYPYVPPHLLDDFIVSMSVLFNGKRLVSANDVFAYERAAVKSSDEFRRKRRIACRVYSSHRYLWPQVSKLSAVNLYKYISHRLIRWYGGFIGAVCALCVLVGIGIGFGWLMSGIVTAICLLALIASLTMQAPIITHIGAAIQLLWANTLGLLDSWAGKTYQTWQPPESR